MSKKIIVVGLSAASVAFITKLRSFDKESEIICFSAEPDMPYNRCLLADFLTGELEQQALQLKDLNFYQNNNIQVFFNTYVTRLDTPNNRVYVQDMAYEYDYLFLGIGTRPFVPKSLAIDDIKGVFTFHTLQDMVAINQYIDDYKPRNAVVIGAGLNGMEAVSSLHQKGIEVTVVEAQETILPGQVQADVASWLLQHITVAGVTAYMSTKVVSIQSQQGQVSGALLDSQSVVPADMVIVAAGSLVNSELVQHAGIELLNGSIVVSDRMQTSISNIFAAGDVCIVPDFITKKMVRSTTWSDAMLQGLCA
nr:NAD(P)/FAD-dependent oxidoreductase [Candidatus Babeliales bacterium]